METQPLSKQLLLKRIKELKTECDREEYERYNVMRSKAYQAAEQDEKLAKERIEEINKELSIIAERKAEMLEAVSDSRSMLEELKMQMIHLMQLEGVEGYTQDDISVSGKWSEKRRVDGAELLRALDGDIDVFMSIVKPSQKSIKDYAQEYPEKKKQLLNCIKLESREIIDIDIQLKS